MTYKIVPIAEEYIIGFYRALDTVAKEKKYLRMIEAPHISKTRKFIMNNIENDYPQFVVVVNDEVVGWCDIIPGDKDTNRHVGTMGMGLIPEFRGRGLGAKLLRKTLEKAQKSGIKRVELTVIEDNINAVGLYKKLGFAIEGINKKAHCVDGEYKDVYMMALLDF